jgi:3-oxoacyl-[acyl-carrier protein] reductase
LAFLRPNAADELIAKRGRGNMNKQVTLITGASRGIGRQIAVDCAQEGHPVVINFARSHESAEEVVASIIDEGGQAIAVQGDVSIEADARRVISATIDHYGRLDCVINNAGVGEKIALESLTSDAFDQVLKLNLLSAFMVSQAALPHMMKGGGRLIFMSSGAARTGGIISAAYAASKAGMEGLMHYYATYLREHGITANAIAPSLIATDMIDRAAHRPNKSLPLGRYGRPNEIWPAVRMIMETEYLTGQTIHIDAGRYMT